MTRLFRAAAALFLLVQAPPTAAQQTGRVLLAEGFAAYRDLEFAAAGRLIRRALEAQDRPPIAGAERASALMYLGASELLLGNRDRAVEVFRDLVLDNPTFRPDSLVFPPRIAVVFEETAHSTKGVAVTLPPEHRFAPGDSGFPITITVTSPHLVIATIVSPRGAPVRRLHDGTVADSIRLWWSGAGPTGTMAPAGHYRLEVVSLVTAESALRMVRVPIELSISPADTIPWPERPVPTVRQPDLRFLLPGLAAGLVLALPPLLGTVDGEGTRITLGAAVAAIGLAASLRTSRIPSAADQRAWAGTLASVREENTRRRVRAPVLVRVGTPQRIERGGG
ncbi:MAG TPA: hypothetical protein VF970_04390 [Gemmatimonadales bacterium]